jgi:hypothetical protein
MMVQEDGIEPAAAQPLDQTSRLPVRAVIDAAVEREHTDLAIHPFSAVN